MTSSTDRKHDITHQRNILKWLHNYFHKSGDGEMHVLTPKFGKSRHGLGRPVRPGPRGGLTGCAVAGPARGARRSNRPWGRSNRVTPISGRVRSLAWFRVVKCYLQGKTSHPINIKGRGRLRAIIQSNISNFILFFPNPSFSNLYCSHPSSPRWLREFWVACRSQDNPRRSVPDGVPPGAANLGFSTFLLSKAIRPAPQAVRPARAGRFGELISGDRVI
jgi:hypothetical protein